jgi:2-keto-myo-inositol isomerase
MSAAPLRFALNHIVAPGLDYRAFFDLAVRTGIDAVELRNEIEGNAIKNGTPPSAIREAAKSRDLNILSINALRRFNDWNRDREKEADQLIGYARECGAQAIVICPVNDPSFDASGPERLKNICDALMRLKPMLADSGIHGLIEAVGFPASTLSLKREAAEAIDAVDGGTIFKILHDSFHHYLAKDSFADPRRIGLMHISGVADNPAPRDDSPRILVDERDLLNTTRQMAALRSGGYDGYFSFEPFSPSVQNADDIACNIKRSVRFIESRLLASDLT